MQKTKARTHVGPHVGYGGQVNQLNSYLQKITNTELAPFLIESLTPDLDFDMEWMVQLDEPWKREQYKNHSLIGNTTIVLGPSLCGKSGYVFMRKQRQFQIKTININCTYYSTPHSLISIVVEELAVILQKTLASKATKKPQKEQMLGNNDQLYKRLIIQNDINLKQLDKHIQSKPNLKILIILKNAQKLVEQKRQNILYSFLQWIKTEIKSQVGIVFITRCLNFIDRMEKRVKSRINPRTVCLFSPQNEKVIKEALVKRFIFAGKTVPQVLKSPLKKFITIFQKSTLIEKLIKQEITHAPKQIGYFLATFSQILALRFDNQQQFAKCLKSSAQIQHKIQQGYKQSKQHLFPSAERQKIILRQMNFPQFIVMGIIRKMLIDQKTKLTFKQIRKQLIQFKKQSYKTTSNSFDFADRVFERGLRNLEILKIVNIYNFKDFQNGDIISNMLPEAIKDAVMGRDDLPEIVKSLFS